jgi:uncharacterized membrane protein
VDLYSILKYMHVVLAILWLGGGMALIVAGRLFQAGPDRAPFLAVVDQVVALSPRIFIPASILLLVSGLAMVWTAGLGWPAWIVLGIAGIAFTAIFGIIKLKSLADSAQVAGRAGDQARAHGLGTTLLRLASFDYCVQFAIVWLMVTKPQWGDPVLLVPPAVLILLGAALFLRPGKPALA